MADPDWGVAPEAGEDAVFLSIEVTPGADRTQFPTGFNAWRGRLTARVAAPALAGRANEAVLAAVADFFRVPAARVHLVAGAASRQKRLRIDGLDAANASRRLREVLDGS